MNTAKDEIKKILENIPDDSTFEDIQYHIYVREKIEKGLQDIKEGNVISQDEIDQCPYPDRKIEIFRLSSICKIRIGPEKKIYIRAKELNDNWNLSPKDAIHIACS